MAIYDEMIGHDNLSVLAEKNTALLEKLDFDVGRDDPFELDNPDIFRESGLFTTEAIAGIFGNEHYTPPPRTRQIAPTIGMLLIRPDMTQITPQVEDFIAERFQLLDSATTDVTPETYWAMYGDAVVGRETRQSRLTRAAVYIGSPCRLLIFERPETKQDEIPAADYLFTNLKGRQGVRQDGTLRGDIVYNGAIRAGVHALTDPETALAVDPFGAYRKIVRDGVESPCHTLAHPLLFFTGVGIHVPNYQEMQRDLALLDPQQEDDAYAA